jgi:hypothetical protein
MTVKSFGLIAILLPLAGLSDIVFDAGNNFGDVKPVKACKLERTGKSLRITGIGRDMAMSLPPVWINTADIEAIEYRYRAKGTGSGSGQLYYSWDGAGASDARRWRLPPPKPDGQWHTVRLGREALSVPESWDIGAKMVHLRFDPTDSAGGGMG